MFRARISLASFANTAPLTIEQYFVRTLTKQEQEGRRSHATNQCECLKLRAGRTKHTDGYSGIDAPGANLRLTWFYSPLAFTGRMPIIRAPEKRHTKPCRRTVRRGHAAAQGRGLEKADLRVPSPERFNHFRPASPSVTSSVPNANCGQKLSSQYPKLMQMHAPTATMSIPLPPPLKHH